MPRRRRPLRPRRALLVLAGLAAATASANVRAPEHLADLTLEQLANVVVTSAARREQPLAQVAGSIYVITAEDIRRAGVRTLPEALRLAPNLVVARTDANNYAISARGFANTLANRLLVMIDGRTVFSPLFSGVFWDAQDVMLEDVERIEVIDGPAGTLWGTNAVHGVINVITRPARATLGTYVAAGGGDVEWSAAARYGGATADGGAWRVFARGYGTEASRFADGRSVGDASERVHAGFRYDGAHRSGAWTVQGDLYAADVDQAHVTRDLAGGNLLARWSRSLAGGAALVVQAYYDRTEREHPGTFRATLDTIDVEGQASLRVTPAQTLLVGAGVRWQRDRVTNSAAQAFVPPHRTLRTFYGVVQDEIALSETLALTAGVKAERNEYTGVELLPSLRLRWQPEADIALWGAVSRAVRAPARIDRELYIPGLPPFTLVGNDSFDSEVANIVEAGARGHAGSRVTWSLTAFHHDHDRLRSIEPAGESRVLANGIEGTTSGVQGWASWQVLDAWRLSVGGLEMRQRLRVKPGVVDLGGLAALGNDPKRQWLLRSAHDLGDAVELDVIARYVGQRPNPRVPGYAAVDVRLGWRLSPVLDVALVGANLFDRRHPEWAPAAGPAEFPRAWFVRLAARL